MFKKLFNPFTHVAGIRSLFWGVKIILITSILGYFFNIHFPDVISVKMCSNYSLWYFLIQSFSNWIIISLIFYISSLLFSKSKIRVIDMFGTQALARFPYLLAPFTGISQAPIVVSEYILYTFLGMGDPVEITSGQIAITIIMILVTLLLTIWLIALMFNAFKVSSNIKGAKSVILFIIGLILSMVISIIVTNQLIQIFS